MNLVELDLLLPHVRQLVAGPLDPWMIEALLKSAMTFCRDSEVVTTSRVVSSMADGQAVAVSDSYDLISVRIISVTSGGQQLTPGDDYLSESPANIMALRPLSQVRIHYVVSPRSDSDVVPEVLVTHYPDAVAAGAAHYLCMQPNRPWSDPQRAAYFHTEMREGVRTAFRAQQEQAAPEQQSFRNPTRRRNFF